MLIFSFRNELMMIIKDLKEEFFFIKANKESRGDKTHFFERKNLCSGMGCLFYEMEKTLGGGAYSALTVNDL